MGGAHGLTTWRQLVDHTHVEVAVKRHGKGARNRSSGHHQHVWWVLALAPEFGTLGHTETVLLIDHDHAQTGELHRIFYDGMGTYEDMDGTV